MSHVRVRQAVIFLVVVQALVLVTLPLQHGARVARGTTVLLQVEPVDPLDLARGAYVELRYEVEELDVPSGTEAGDEAFVVLDPPARDGGVWTGRRVVLDEDDIEPGEVFLRLSMDSDGTVDFHRISTYYEDAEGAVDLERELTRGGAVARVSVDEDGSPTLLRVNPRRDG